MRSFAFLLSLAAILFNPIQANNSTAALISRANPGDNQHYIHHSCHIGKKEKWAVNYDKAFEIMGWTSLSLPETGGIPPPIKAGFWRLYRFDPSIASNKERLKVVTGTYDALADLHR
jgi:hypothetical protein